MPKGWAVEITAGPHPALYFLHAGSALCRALPCLFMELLSHPHVPGCEAWSFHILTSAHFSAASPDLSKPPSHHHHTWHILLPEASPQRRAQGWRDCKCIQGRGSPRRVPPGHGSEQGPKGQACPLHPEHPQEARDLVHPLPTPPVNAEYRYQGENTPWARASLYTLLPSALLWHSTVTPTSKPRKEQCPVDGKPAGS